MSTEVRVSGGGAFEGAASAIFDYSVTEESTPITLADSTGGIGQVTFNAVDDTSRKGSGLLLGSTITLEDTDRGTIVGKVTSLNGANGIISVSAESRIGKLVATRNANPVNGTFGEAIAYYLGLAGVTGSNFTIDSSLVNQSVITPGWKDQDVWTKIKELCAVNNAEISLVGAQVVVRALRKVEVATVNMTSTWSATEADLQSSFTMNYYNSSYREDFLVEPEGGWSPEARVLQVEVGETVVENIPVNMWVTSVQQPVAQDKVARSYTDSSVYSIVGNDGFPIPAAQWRAHGGRMSFAIGADKTSIDVTLSGVRPDTATAKYAPFRVAVSSKSEYYSTLRIVATGVYFVEKSVVIYTGVKTSDGAEDGTTIASQFVRTKKEAYEAGLSIAQKFSAPVRTVTFTTNDFETVNTISQTFGNIAGARVRWRRAVYRVRSAVTTQSSVEFTAEEDTTFDDFQTSAAGMTFDDFQDSFAGLTFDDFNQIPLPTVKPEYDDN